MPRSRPTDVTEDCPSCSTARNQKPRYPQQPKGKPGTLLESQKPSQSLFGQRPKCCNSCWGIKLKNGRCAWSLFNHGSAFSEEFTERGLLWNRRSTIAAQKGKSVLLGVSPNHMQAQPQCPKCKTKSVQCSIPFAHTRNTSTSTCGPVKHSLEPTKQLTSSNVPSCYLKGPRATIFADFTRLTRSWRRHANEFLHRAVRINFK